ncbi:MAG: hypothetical protein JNM57_13620 [Cyclobacteriaceae bacterium]|nr:hypothetical protein [Cyclobacteriaceae bacterium]
MKLIIILPLVFCFSRCVGQEEKIKTITTTHEIIFAAVDRPGDFYVVLQNGTIEKYDKNGKKLAQKVNSSKPTIFDPRDGARLFVYFQHDLRYQYLNPELKVVNELTLDSAFAINPLLLCPAGDRELWILDTADYTLKRTVLMGTSLKQESEIKPTAVHVKPLFTYMREYQNFLFLLDKNAGILIFNTMGKRIKTIHVPGLPYFNFLGEELYYPDGNKIKFLDLISGETSEQQFSVTGDFILLTDERYISIRKNTIEVFRYKR